MMQSNKPKQLPSLNNEQLWHFIGERGVYSQSPEHMLSCFDVFVHHEGKLYYRMKLKKDRVPVTETSASADLFVGTTFHDPMEAFINRRETKDEVAVMSTHYSKDNEENERGDEIEELENNCTIPFQTFFDKFN